MQDLHESADVDALMHKVAQHLRIVLGHANNHHVWYRISLTAPNNAAATIFDDLTQVSRYSTATVQESQHQVWANRT